MIKALFITITIFSAAAKTWSSPYKDSLIVEHLKKEKFNLELYELAFCSRELLQILEEDSMARNEFMKRIERAFDERLSQSQLYFHQLEYDLLSGQISEDKDVKLSYPKALSLIQKLAPEKLSYDYKGFATHFQNYIEYPEQTDDACIIALVTNLPKTIWKEIESDKLALYRFNTWLEFGFEEFRYYPGLKSTIKSTINDRIISFIKEKYSVAHHPLIAKSLDMINSMEERYQKETE